MFKNLLFIVLLFFCASLFSYGLDEPVFKIETEIHNGRVNQMLVDRSQNIILTASSDKTAKLWDLEEGSLLKTYRPYVFSEAYGQINTVSLAPSGEYIALAGRLYENSHQYFVDIFSAQSAEVIQTISEFRNPVEKVLFSFNSRELIICSGEKFYIIDIQNGRVIFSTNISGICTALLKDEINHKIYCSTTKGFIYALNRKNGKFVIENHSNSFAGKEISHMVLSPEKTRIALSTAEDNLISIVDSNTLQRLKTLNNAYLKGTINTLAWSTDGDKIYASGDLTDFNQDNMIVYWKYSSPSERKRLYSTSDEITHMELFEDGSIVYMDITGKLHKIGGFDANYKAQIGTLSNSEGVYDIRSAQNGSVVQIMNANTATLMYFDLINLHLMNGDAMSVYGKLNKPQTANFSLNLVDWKDSKTPKLGYDILTLDKDEISNTIAINKKATAFLLATNQGIRKYNKQGDLLWNIKTQEDIKQVLITEEEDKVISIDKNGMISWYRYADGKQLASLFIPETKDSWILFSPLGYFASKGAAEEFAGWQINREWDKSADFYPFERFFEEFYNPQIPVNAVLNLVSDEHQQIEYALPEPITENTIGRTPEVQFERTSFETTKEKVSISVFADGFEESIKDIILAVNGKIIDGGTVSNEMENFLKMTWIVELSQGENLLETYAINQSNVESEKLKIKIFRKVQQTSKPNLYLISSGVSKYHNSLYDLNYAANDSEAIATFIKDRSKNLYQNVYSYQYDDDKALKKNIQDAVNDLNKKMNPDDTFILFFSGHGVILDKDPENLLYSLAYHEIDLSNKDSGMSTEDLETIMKRVKAQNTVVIIDACHSEYAVDTDDLYASYINKAAKSISKKTGIGVFMSSAKDQYSYESKQLKQGIFTYSIISSVRNDNTDANDDGIVQTGELAEILDIIVPQNSKKYVGHLQTPHNFTAGKKFDLFTE